MLVNAMMCQVIRYPLQRCPSSTSFSSLAFHDTMASPAQLVRLMRVATLVVALGVAATALFAPMQHVAADATTLRGFKCADAVAIEHLFFDTTQPNWSQPPRHDEAAAGAPVAPVAVSPVSLKLRCKGSGCPELNGTRVVLDRVPGHVDDLSGVPVWCEETSGWLLFWRDAQWTIPLVPAVLSAEEKRSGYVYVNEHRGSVGGSVKFNCVFS